MKEKDRIQEKEINLTYLLSRFKNTKYIGFQDIYFRLCLNDKDAELARLNAERTLKRNIEYDRFYEEALIDMKDEEVDKIVQEYHEIAKKSAKLLIIREEILADTSLSMMERIQKARKHYCDLERGILYHELYRDIYEYEVKMLAIDMAYHKDAKGMELLIRKELKHFKKWLHRYRITVEGKAITSNTMYVNHIFEVNDKNIEDFKRINLDDLDLCKIYLYDENDETIFIYDYSSLMYYLDGDWINIGGTLAN